MPGLWHQQDVHLYTQMYIVVSCARNSHTKSAMNAKFSRALQNGELIHVTSLNERTDKGLACNCTCIECGKEVQFVTRRRPLTTKFFRHHEPSSCGGGMMTALHRAAQQILVRNRCFRIEQTELLYENAVMERQLGSFRADVYANSADGKPLVYEVVVNCDLTESKIAYLEAQRINSIRFDLEHVSSKISDHDLEDLIVNNTQIKSYIYWEKPHQIKSLEVKTLQTKDDNAFWIMVGLVILGGLGWLSRSRHINDKRKRQKNRLF